MKESPFVKIFEDAAKLVTGSNLTIKRKTNLLYQLYLDNHLNLCVNDIKHPKRGNSAFQVDLCIFQNRGNDLLIPRIAIEFKTRITTHDILTYSSKAGKHKDIYPFLRYGMIASDVESIPGRFFIHNNHIDFMIAAKAHKNKSKLLDFAKELINQELKISHILEDIHFKNKKYDYYRKDIVFKNFKK